MDNRTSQRVADELNALRARSVNIVQGTISGAASPGGTVSFTYTGPIDGQTYTAQGTAWNACSPSKVSALKMEDGSWVVVGGHEAATAREAVHTDRRARPKSKNFGKIKILFSKKDGDQTVFYIGGDRATPKRIFSTKHPAAVALIHNLGDGDRYIVGIVFYKNERESEIVILSPSPWMISPPKRTQPDVINDVADINNVGIAYRGHGWAWVIETTRRVDILPPDRPGFSIWPDGNLFSYFRRKTAELPYRDNAVGDSRIFNTPVTPKTVKTSILGGQESRLIYDVVLGLNAATAIYKLVVVNDSGSAENYFLISASTNREIKLGGDLPNAITAADNLLGRNLHQVVWQDAVLNQRRDLEVESFALSEKTTKRTARVNVFSLNLNFQIQRGSQPETLPTYFDQPIIVYNASYHP